VGEWMVQVPVKLDPETVARLDLLRGSYPFKPGRSTVIRELVEEGLRLIAEGIMQFRATTSNRVPSVQSVPGIPSEFPVPQAGQAKPPVRVARTATGRGQESHIRSGRTAMAMVPFRITSLFNRLQGNSTRRAA